MSNPQFPVTDEYLARQQAPQQEIKIDPQYGTVRLVTPIGRLAFVTLQRPKSVKQPDGSSGPEQFSCTILLNPVACGDIYRAIVMVAANRFPPEQKPNPQNPQEMVLFSADNPDPSRNLLFLPTRSGGLHYPLRAGSENYMREPSKYDEWKSLFFLNTSMYAVNPNNGNPQRPVCKNEQGVDVNPELFYSGCYGRLQVTLFAYPKPGAQGRGSRGVGVGLNAVQFARHGEKLGGFDASKAAGDAFAAAGAIPVDQSQQQTGYGPNSATPNSVPPGAMPGFAAPPAQQSGFAAPPQQGVPAANFAPTAPVPPGTMPPAGAFVGARPPGT